MKFNQYDVLGFLITTPLLLLLWAIVGYLIASIVGLGVCQ